MLDPRLRWGIMALDAEQMAHDFGYCDPDDFCSSHSCAVAFEEAWTLLTERLLREDPIMPGLIRALYEALLGHAFKGNKFYVSPWCALLALQKAMVGHENDEAHRQKLDHNVALLISEIPLEFRDAHRDYGFPKKSSAMMMACLCQHGPCTIDSLYNFGERFSLEEGHAAAEAVSMMKSSVLLLESETHSASLYFKAYFSNQRMRALVGNSRIKTEADGGTLLHRVCRHSEPEELPLRIRFLIRNLLVNPALSDDKGLTATNIVVERKKKADPSSFHSFELAIRLLREDRYNYHHIRTLNEIRALKYLQTRSFPADMYPIVMKQMHRA